MSLINWDYYDDIEVYSDTHDIEVDQEIQNEIMIPANPQIAPEQPTQHDMNTNRQTSLHEFFKGGRTHVAQSRNGRYHQKRRA